MSIVQKSQKALEYDKILAELAKFAKTEQSRKLCLDLTPFVKPEDIQAQLILTREAKDVLDLARDIPIEKIPDFAKLRERNEYFVEEELVDIAKSMRTSRIVRNFLKENLPFDASMQKLADDLFSNKEFEEKKLRKAEYEAGVEAGVESGIELGERSLLKKQIKKKLKKRKPIGLIADELEEEVTAIQRIIEEIQKEE